jgi:cobalamin biosynthesis Co2+ chelatase CbiK
LLLESVLVSALAMRLSHDVFLVAHGTKRSKNTVYAISFFLPSKNSSIAIAGVVTFCLPLLDDLPEVWNQSSKNERTSGS